MTWPAPVERNAVISASEISTYLQLSVCPIDIAAVNVLIIKVIELSRWPNIVCKRFSLLFKLPHL